MKTAPERGAVTAIIFGLTAGLLGTAFAGIVAALGATGAILGVSYASLAGFGAGLGFTIWARPHKKNILDVFATVE
jgi:hypothetical protein